MAFAPNRDAGSVRRHLRPSMHRRMHDYDHGACSTHCDICIPALARPPRATTRLMLRRMIERELEA